MASFLGAIWTIWGDVMRKLVSVVCAMLFVISAFNMVPVAFSHSSVKAASSRACPGGWTINSAITVGPGETCVVSSNILIQSGGSLTVKKSTIKMNVASDGQYNITVQNGGQLHIIQNSTLTSNDGVHRSNLKAQSGSTLEIRDSDLSYLGYLMPNIGIEIYTSNAVVDNNNITHGFQGVYVQGATAQVTNNRVLGMDQTGIEASVSNSYIANNTVKNSGARGIMIDQGGASMKVYNNTLYDNYEGIHLKVNTLALIQGNWVDQHNNSGRDIIVDQSDPIIDGNHLKNANAGIQYMGLCGGVAKNNIIQYGDGNQDVGIKVQQQSNPQIINNTIDHFWRGMQVTGLSNPVVEKNTITNSIHAGIYLNSGSGTYRNNTITTATGDGINMISNTDAKFYDNWIHDNGNDGIHVDSSKVVIINNNISKNPITGLHLIGTPTTADVQNNLFNHDGNGVVLGDTAIATLRNNDFLDNVGGAINVGASTHVDWTVDKTVLARNNDITLAGNLTIKSTGNLELRNLYMRIASTASKKYWIDAQGPLFLNVSFLAAQTPANPYSLRTTSDLKVVDGGITNAGYTYAGLGEDAGVFLNGGTGTFLRSYISSGFYGLIANGGSVTMEKCSIDNNGMDGIKAEGGATVIVSNSTMTLNTDKDLVLDGVSTIDMRNSTFNGNAVTLSDANSKLHVSWFVGVKVAWPDLSGNPGDPVNGATVVVKQAGGTEVATRVTDANGTIGPYLILREYTKMQSGKTDYSPYNITASISPIVVGYKVAPIQQSQVITVLLGDLTPPLVNITTPLDNAVFNYVNITIKGTASDPESGIKSVAVSTDDGASWKPALGTTNWNITLFFGEGTYKIIAKACNPANGCTTASVSNIYVDKTPPIILWTSPANNSLLNKKNVVVSGTTEANAQVTVNTVQTNATGAGAFSVDVPLTEGPNTLTVTASDRAHNSRSSARYVTVDTIAPFINIDGPLNKTVTVMQIEITGTTEVGAKVSVNSGAVNVNPSTGIFSYPVLLTEGPNMYKFDAVDKAGNTNSITVTITLDTKAPALTVVYPADGTTLKNKTVKAQALTEPNPEGTLKGFINGQQVTVDANGAFGGDVSLVEGNNVITFRVEDAAGNNASKTVRVSLDSSVPTITELTPATGTQLANTQTTVWIEGKTEPKATVTIGTKTTTAGAQGDFSIEVPLAVGPNNITIKVTDRAGNTYTKSITITRKPSGGCVGAGCTHNDNNTTKPGTDWSKFLPFILIIVVILAVVGAAAAFAGRKAPPPPPRRRREEDYPRGRDQYARGVERGGAYPRAPGSQEPYDEGYDQGPAQGEYDQGYGDDQYNGQGNAQEGYDQGTQDQGYSGDQYANQGPSTRGRRY
jgi:parallel beta-helix repeat protein